MPDYENTTTRADDVQADNEAEAAHQASSQIAPHHAKPMGIASGMDQGGIIHSLDTETLRPHEGGLDMLADCSCKRWHIVYPIFPDEATGAGYNRLLRLIHQQHRRHVEEVE